LDVEKLEEKLGGKTEQERVPIPIMDAFEVLEEISKRIPKSVVHDLEQIEIKPKRVTIKGLINPNLGPANGVEADTDSESDEERTEAEAQADTESDEGSDLAPTDLIKMKLDEFKECFTAIRVGRVSTVGNRRRYQMDIDSRCP
jgi:hypothetical protein